MVTQENMWEIVHEVTGKRKQIVLADDILTRTL